MALLVPSAVVSFVQTGDQVSGMTTSAHWHISCSPVGSLMNMWLGFSMKQAVVNMVRSKLHIFFLDLEMIFGLLVEVLCTLLLLLLKILSLL